MIAIDVDRLSFHFCGGPDTLETICRRLEDWSQQSFSV